MVESSFGHAYGAAYNKKKNEWLVTQIGLLGNEMAHLKDLERVFVEFHNLVLLGNPVESLEDTSIKAMFDRIQRLKEIEDGYPETKAELIRLREVEKQYIELKAKMKVLADQYARVAAKSHELPARQRELEAERRTWHDQIRHLTHELEVSQEEVKRLTSMNESMRRGADIVLQERLVGIERAYFKEKEERERLQLENDKLAPLRGGEEEIEALRSKCALQSSQLQHLKVLQKRCMELQSQVNSHAAAAAECARLRGEVDRLSSYQDLYLAVQKEYAEMTTIREDRATIQAKLDYVEREKVVLERQLNALQGREYRHLDAERDNHAFSRMLERKVQEVTEECNHAQSQLHKANLDRAIAIADKNQAEGELRLLQEKAKQFPLIQEKVRHLEQANGKLNEELDRLTTQLKAERASKDQVENDTIEMRVKLQKLEELKAYHFLPSLTAADTALAATPRGCVTHR
uniref:Uncharacterized protein n=1 Tax=Eutreptiella gymnastica TaxID=73025 RepID=A0A7S1IYQ2_9EUGL|mmetsp:Transcript_53299/g.95139  ORF Transcript_53299/g.95139 Transcript_53299/m.95139 type:complete len:462 (+) Transcript_53299:56-1441(+)